MKKLRNLFIIMIFAFIGIVNVNAEEQYSIKVDAKTGSAGSILTMTLEGIDFESALQNDVEYLVKFVNEVADKPIITENPYLITEAVGNTPNKYNQVNVYQKEDTGLPVANINITDDWYLLKGYELAYIIKCPYGEECSVSDTPVEVKKPALPQLTQRYHNYLFGSSQNGEEFDDENTLSVFPYFPYGEEIGSHEINVKIGLINDETLLKKLAKNETGSLEKLMEYAKTANGTVITESDSNFYNKSIGDFKVQNGAYYYMYTYYTNTDGVYRNLDDIAVVMGESGMLVNDVDWSKYNIKDELWEKFVEKYKNTEVLDLFNENYNFEVQSTDNSLKVAYSNNEGINGETNFSYENGILTYIPSEDESVKFLESLLVANSLQAIVDLYGYDVEKIDAWVEQDRKFTLAADGIEFEKVTKKDVDGNSTLEYDVFNSFKMDIRGLKSFETENKPEELKKNPSTATNLGYGILITILVTGILGYIYIKKQSKFPKHN